MPPQKAMPVFDNMYMYSIREDDGPSPPLSIRKISERDENSYQRRGSNASTSLIDDSENYIVGDRVWVGGTKPGVIAFIGETQFGPGDWAGVVLDEPIGKNDGAVAGVRYFQCAQNKGIFARPSRLSRFPTSSAYNNSHTPAHCSTPVTPDRNHRTLSSASFSSSVASSRLRTPLSHSTSGNSEVKVGDRVIVQSSHGSKAGMLRYYGATEFGSGLWCGVELDDPLGKNDGSVAGVKYFDCAPKFGLFVPAEKVSRSPISKKVGLPCVIHPDSITRQGTHESLRSTSTIQTSATSNLRTNRKPLSKTTGSSFTSAPRSPLQDQVREKEAYINQLLKERELERAQITTAATQAEEAEKKLAALKAEYEEIFAQQEIQNTNLVQTIEKLEKEKTTLLQQVDEGKKRLEDLQFNFEEESITKSEIQALNEEYVEKLKNLEKVVSSQHASLEYDAQSSGIFTAEGDSEKGSSPGAQLPSLQTEQNDFTEELISSRKMIAVLTEKTAELENECQQLRENLDKSKLVDKSKEEMINTLRKELTTFQQSSIIDDLIPSSEELQTEIETLKSKLMEIETENCTFKSKLADTTEKISILEHLLEQKNEHLNKVNAILRTEQEESKIQIEKIKNDLQFELDESKVRIEEMIFKMDELTSQLTAKEKESSALAECIARLCDEIDQRNTIVSRVILDTEDAAKNIADAINAATNLRRKEGTLPHFDDCDQPTKEKVLLLLERIEQSSENNIVLLKKLETLAEVISRKDTLIEESADEKEALRKEFQESIQQKTNELKQLEMKYADLDKVKIDIEAQLRRSEENVKKLEQLFSGKDNELKNEIANISRELEKKHVEHDLVNRELTNLQNVLKAKETESCNERETFEKEILELKSQMENINSKMIAVQEEKQKLRKDYIELRKLNEFTMRVIGGENDDSIENFAITIADDDDLAHVQAVEKNVQTYEEEYDKLKKIIDGLKVNNSDKEREISNLEEMRKQQQSEIETLKKEQDHLQVELTTTSKTIESLNTNTTETQQKIATLENTCKQYKDEKEVIKKEKEDLREELQKVTIILESQKTQFADTESETAALKEKLIANAIIEAQLNDLRNEYKRLEDSFKLLEDTNNEIKSELETTNNEKIQLKSLLDAREEEKENLTQKTSDYSSEVKILGEKLTERDRQLVEVQEKLKILQDKSKEATEELTRVQGTNHTLEQTNASLLTELNSVKNQLTTLENETQSKEAESNLEKQILEEKIQAMSNASDDIKAKDEQLREANRRQASELNNKLQALQQELEIKERGYREELAEIEKTAKKLAIEKETAETQLETAKSEIIKLSCHDGGGDVGKTETKLILNDNLNNNVISTNNTNDKYSQLLEDKTIAEDQIQFLNSVIVDMQHKNETLLERVQYLENIVPPELLKPKKVVTPRLFCDICDVFDLHDTDDCPVQCGSSTPPPVRREISKTKPPPRPYCENCEVFGHTRGECNDEETF